MTTLICFNAAAQKLVEWKSHEKFIDVSKIDEQTRKEEGMYSYCDSVIAFSLHLSIILYHYLTMPVTASYIDTQQ